MPLHDGGAQYRGVSIRIRYYDNPGRQDTAPLHPYMRYSAARRANEGWGQPRLRGRWSAAPPHLPQSFAIEMTIQAQEWYSNAVPLAGCRTSRVRLDRHRPFTVTGAPSGS